MNIKKVKLTKSLKKMVIQAANYVDNGDPWSDVMDDSDIAELIEAVAKHLKENK